MTQAARLPILLILSSLIQPAFVSTIFCADCVVECMERSGCWSGRSVSDPAGCRNMPELCGIQCRGQANNVWGAIAYSKPDQAAGWSYEKSDKLTAERVALQECARQGGAQCIVQTSFSKACGAVAVDGNVVTWGVEATKAGAQQRAMTECGKAGGKKCALEAAVCSMPGASSAPPTAPPPPKAIAWGAIAYSSHDMGAGWAQGKDNQASAEKEALAKCQERGKACVVKTAFNKQCGALAADGDYTGFAASTDQRVAMQKAMDDCKKNGGSRCVLHIMFCSI
jgi:hypothetical protein